MNNNDAIEKRLIELIPKNKKKYHDCNQEEKEAILAELIRDFGPNEVEEFFKQVNTSFDEKIISDSIDYQSSSNSLILTSCEYKKRVSSGSIDTSIFRLKLIVDSKDFDNKSNSSKDLKLIKSKLIPNIDMYLAIRELLNGIDKSGITQSEIKGLNNFIQSFNKIAVLTLPPRREIDNRGRGTKIISEFKSKVFTQETSFDKLKELKIHRLTTPISELFDFVLYLKDSSHASITKLNIQDDEERLSYNYFTSHKNKKYIYLDDILFGNLGLVWQDDCTDATKLKISDCLKLQRESDETKLSGEFDKHKNKDARIYACYTISQNPYLSEKLAEEVLTITESSFKYFPYPKDYQAMIDAIHTNIHKIFPNVIPNNNEQNDEITFKNAFEDFKKLDSTVWYKGLELTSNEYSSRKTVLSKKDSESTNDYREYIQLKSEWLWSISNMIENFWTDEKCYGIALNSSQFFDYALYALDEVKNDEIIDSLHQKLKNNEKYKKLLLEDYDFYILTSLLSMAGNIHVIIRRLLVTTYNKSAMDKELFKNYQYWLEFVEKLFVDDEPLKYIDKLESHPDMYGDLAYSFHEIWTSIRFWLKNCPIDAKRIKKLAIDGWQREKYYFRLKHEKNDDDNFTMALFTYLCVYYCFGNESEKDEAIREIDEKSSLCVYECKKDKAEEEKKEKCCLKKKINELISKELRDFGSLKNEYKIILEKLKGFIDEK